jgi:hypothetical protein
VERPDEDTRTSALLPVPSWLVAVHLAFMAWTVVTAHYPALFIGGFLFFLGFARATSPYQSRMSLKTPLLVGFFLAGSCHSRWPAGLVDRSSTRQASGTRVVFRATALTAVNDNALITYLATLVPHLDDRLKLALVQGRLPAAV